LLALAVSIVLGAALASAQNDTLGEMVRAEQRFAARGLAVGWKQAFLEYFADNAIGFDGEQVLPAKDIFRKAPDPPRDRKLIWEPLAAIWDISRGPYAVSCPGRTMGSRTTRCTHRCGSGSLTAHSRS